MEITYQDEQFCCWGTGLQGGTYVLRLVVSQPREIRFGRFQKGQPIAVPSGNYLYVGSALAQKGPTSLARRLLRHASRSDAQNPQPIRQEMLALFPKIGLGPTLLHPPSGKKLRWHVDFLLDEPGVALTAVYIIRSGGRKGNTEIRGEDAELRREQEGKLDKSVDFQTSVFIVPSRQLETAVARWLLSFPEVRPLVPGLGSTDDPGGTHLLAVTAVPTWWTALPNYMTNFLRENAV